MRRYLLVYLGIGMATAPRAWRAVNAVIEESQEAADPMPLWYKPALMAFAVATWPFLWLALLWERFKDSDKNLHLLRMRITDKGELEIEELVSDPTSDGKG